MLKEIVSQDKKSYFVSSDLEFDKYFSISLDRHFIYHYDDFGTLHYLAYFDEPSRCIAFFDELRFFFCFSDYIRYVFPTLNQLYGWC